MQLNKAVPSKHSSGERVTDCGVDAYLPQTSFISSLALNKLLLKESLHRKFHGRNGWGKPHMKAKSSREQSQPRYFRIYLQVLGR